MTEAGGDSGFIEGVLAALAPFASDLVIIGGWAHRLFRLHPMAAQDGVEPLTTEDVDLVLPSVLGKREGLALGDVLERRRFEPREKSTHTRPPLWKYARGTEIVLEFVCDLDGSPTDRKGERRDSIEVSGVTAELLRYIYVLRLEPWCPWPTSQHAHLRGARVAHPVSYLFQKVLAFSKRPPASHKRANDILYIADTLRLFSKGLPDLAEEWNRRVKPQVHAKHVSTFETAARRLVKDEEALTEAVRIGKHLGREVDRTRLTELIKLGLSSVFARR